MEWKKSQVFLRQIYTMNIDTPHYMSFDVFPLWMAFEVAMKFCQNGCSPNYEYENDTSICESAVELLNVCFQPADTPCNGH